MIPLRCPNCSQPLASESLTCPQGHQYHWQNGVLVLLKDAFATQLRDFSATLTEMRQNEQKRLLDAGIYPQLPYALQDNIEWRVRCEGLDHIKTILPATPAQKILDVGAYNGWLSHQLSQQGHQLTAIEYFADPYDGLGTIQHYPTDWLPIQMDLTDLTPLDTQFDMVIMNHGLSFFPDPQGQLDKLWRLVRPNGWLVVLGLRFFRNPKRRAQEVEAMQANFRKKYGREMFLRPAKGFLTLTDKKQMARFGLTFHPYSNYRLVNFLSWFVPILPWQGMGVAQK